GQWWFPELSSWPGEWAWKSAPKPAPRGRMRPAPAGAVVRSFCWSPHGRVTAQASRAGGRHCNGFSYHTHVAFVQLRQSFRREKGSPGRPGLAPELGHHVAVRPCHPHVIEPGPPRADTLNCLSNQAFPELPGADEQDRGLLRHGPLAIGVAGKRERAVGEREDVAAMTHPVPV